MAALIDDPARRSELGARAPEVLERFGLTAILGRWDELLTAMSRGGSVRGSAGVLRRSGRVTDVAVVDTPGRPRRVRHRPRSRTASRRRPEPRGRCRDRSARTIAREISCRRRWASTSALTPSSSHSSRRSRSRVCSRAARPRPWSRPSASPRPRRATRPPVISPAQSSRGPRSSGCWPTLVVILLAGPAVALAGPGLAPPTAHSRAASCRSSLPSSCSSALGDIAGGAVPVGIAFPADHRGRDPDAVVSAALTIGLWDSLGVAALGVGITGNAVTTVVVVGIGAWLAESPPIPTISDPGGVTAWTSCDTWDRCGRVAALTSNQVEPTGPSPPLSGRARSAPFAMARRSCASRSTHSGTAWVTASYRALVRSQSRPDGLGGTASSLIRIALALAMPVTFGVAGRGANSSWTSRMCAVAFMADDARRTSAVVASLAPLFVLSMVQAVVIRSDNARRSGCILSMAGVAAAVLNLGLDLLLAPGSRRRGYRSSSRRWRAPSR